jgi:hypothetical protein
MKITQVQIESFINGNISFVKPKLKRRSHRELRQAYQDATGCGDEKATAFADFIKGDITFQHYCDTK